MVAGKIAKGAKSTAKEAAEAAKKASKPKPRKGMSPEGLREYIRKGDYPSPSPGIRGMDVTLLTEDYTLPELRRMRASVSRMRTKLSDKEKASQLNRLDKAINKLEKEKSFVEGDVDAVMKAGQRQFDPATGQEMFRKGGMVPKKKKSKPKTKWLFGFKK